MRFVLQIFMDIHHIVSNRSSTGIPQQPESIFLEPHIYRLYRGIFSQRHFSSCKRGVFFSTPSQILWWGIVVTFVCLSLCKHEILRELSIRFWWNLVRLCIIIIGRSSSKMGLCPLIFKAKIEKKQNIRIDENHPLQEGFSTYSCRICTVDVKLNNLKDPKDLLPW